MKSSARVATEAIGGYAQFSATVAVLLPLSPPQQFCVHLRWTLQRQVKMIAMNCG